MHCPFQLSLSLTQYIYTFPSFHSSPLEEPTSNDAKYFFKTHTALNEEPTKCALRPNVLRETHDSFVHTDGCWVLRHCQTSSTPVTLPLRSRDTYPPADHFYTGVFVLQRLGPILGFDSIKQVKVEQLVDNRGTSLHVAG